MRTYTNIYSYIEQCEMQGKDVLAHALMDKTLPPSDLALIMSHTVNVLTGAKKKFENLMDDSEAGMEMLKISVAFLRSLATAYKYQFAYDARNESACMMASEWQKEGKLDLPITSWEGLIPYQINPTDMKKLKNLDRAGEFAYFMCMEHRALQQNFADIAFMRVEKWHYDHYDCKKHKYK